MFLIVTRLPVTFGSNQESKCRDKQKSKNSKNLAVGTVLKIFKLLP